MKVNITKVHSTNVRKDGTPLKDKHDKPFFRVGLLTREFGDTWINGFLYEDPQSWLNTEKELEIYDEEYQGKTQKKFKQASRWTELNKTLARFEKDIAELKGRVLELETARAKTALKDAREARTPDIPIIDEDEVNKELAGIDTNLPF